MECNVKIGEITCRYSFRYMNPYKAMGEFITDEKEDFSIFLSDEEIMSEGGGNNYPVSYLEYLAFFRAFSTRAIDYSIVLIHSSAVRVGEFAYSFSGVSGAGKTTHSMLYMDLFKDKASFINGDKPYYRIDGDSLVVYGTPYGGKERMYSNDSSKVKGFAFIRQGVENSIRRMDPSEAFVSLFIQVFKPKDESKRKRIEDIIEWISKNIPVYELTCDISIDAAKLSFNTMNNGGIL